MRKILWYKLLQNRWMDKPLSRRSFLFLPSVTDVALSFNFLAMEVNIIALESERMDMYGRTLSHDYLASRIDKSVERKHKLKSKLVFSLILLIIFRVGSQFWIESYCDTGLFFNKVYQKLWSKTIKLRLLVTQCSGRVSCIDAQHW